MAAALRRVKSGMARVIPFITDFNSIFLLFLSVVVTMHKIKTIWYCSFQEMVYAVQPSGQP